MAGLARIRRNQGHLAPCIAADVSAERTRSKSLVIEGIAIPLKVDKQFEAFDKAIQPPFRPSMYGTVLRATLVGRFFAGQRLDSDLKRKPWGGFGHMGLYTASGDPAS